MGTIILIGGNKGGSGKTTIAVNIAVSLALKNHDVCIVDADKQKTATNWHQDREDNKLMPEIQLVEKSGNISQTLKNLRSKYDYIIVDVAGRNSLELISSMTVANILIAPHQSSQFDMDTLFELNTQLVNIEPLNPDLKSYAYQSMANSNPRCWDQERGDFKAFVSESPNFLLAESVNFYRKSYRDSVPFGKSVHEINCQKATSEIEDLVKEVIL